MNAALAMPEVTNAGTDLARSTVCVSVSFGVLGNSRKVSNSAVDVDADKSLIHVSKTLLDSPELAAIKKADGEMRRRLYDLCLPYDVGIYLLPNKLVSDVVRMLREFKAKRAILVERFLSKYETLRQDAETRLRTLYNPRDYPGVDVVRTRFYCDWQFITFGTPESLEGISAQLFEEEKNKAAAKWQSASEEITAVMRATLAELVTHLRDRLTPDADGKPKVLRDTAVTNLTDFLKTFELRNVTNDTELAALASQCKSLLNPDGVLSGLKVDAEFLRNSDSLKTRIRTELDSIKTGLDSLVTAKPSRKFRFDED